LKFKEFFMIWIFASVVLTLLVYHRGFRRWAAWLSGAAAVLVAGIYLFSTPAEADAGRAVVILAELGGIWALAKTFPARRCAGIGSAVRARGRIRNLYAPAEPARAAPWLTHGDAVALIGVGATGCVILFLIFDGVGAVQSGYAWRWVLTTLSGSVFLAVLHAIGGAAVARLRQFHESRRSTANR
jgi:hypothetical protein